MRRLFKKAKPNPSSVKKEPTSASPLQNGSRLPVYTKSKESLKVRLLANYAEALERIVIWFPLFLGAWLSSGFVLVDVLSLALISIPLLFQFLFRNRNSEVEIFMEKEIQLVTRILPLVSALYLYSESSRPDLSICLAFSTLWLELYFLPQKKNSLILIVKALAPSLFMATIALMGILSQLKFTSLADVFIGYCLFGLIPGTVVSARHLLLSVEQFSNLGWKLGSVVKGDKARPTAYTKLVVFMVILGPAIPAMLLPFEILPKSFISSSLVFFVIPKVADKIQNSTDQEELKTASIYLALIAFGLEILVFLSALLGG